MEDKNLEARIVDGFVIGFDTCNRILSDNKEKTFFDKKGLEVIEHVNTLRNIKTVADTRRRGYGNEPVLEELRQRAISYAVDNVNHLAREVAMTPLSNALGLSSGILGLVGVYTQFFAISYEDNLSEYASKSLTGLGLCALALGISLFKRLYIRRKIKNELNATKSAVKSLQQIDLQSLARVLVNNYEYLKTNLPNLT